MYVNDLASMLRAGGMNVVEVGGWQSRNHGSLKTVSSIICHHTAGAATGNFPSLNVVTYGRSDLPGPLCNLGLGRDGTVFVVSNGTAWHAGATINDNIYGNYNSLGIEAENTGTGQAWPEVQVNAYAKLCALLCKHYGVSVDRVKGHKEICSPAGRKVDPANLPGDMNGLRARVTGYISGGDTGTPPATTKDGLELMERITVKASADTISIRVRLPGGPNAKIIVRPPVEGGANPVWLGNVYAWGSDKSGVGGNPKNIVGYNPKIAYSRNVPLAEAVWADVEYSCYEDFIIEVIG